MNIIFQKNPNSDLDATINVTLIASDYVPSFEQAIIQRRAQISLKGFRPGQAPVALIKKLYGLALLEEIVIKLALKSMEEYLDEHAIKLWGQPVLTNNDLHKPSFDIQSAGDLSIQFVCGLLSKIDLEQLKNIQVEHFKITSMEDESLEELISKLQYEYGNREDDIALSQRGDVIYGKLTKGNDFPRSIHLPATITSHDDPTGLLEIKPAQDRNIHICTSHPYELSKEDKKFYSESAQRNIALLNSLPGGDYQFTAEYIQRTTPAELNTAFFNQVLRKKEETITTLEDFKQALQAEVMTSLQQVADDFLDNTSLQEAVLNALAIELPSEFTRQYLLKQNPTADMALVDQWISDERPQLSWSLFTEQIIQEKSLQVTEQEVMDTAKEELSNPTASNPFIRSSTDALRLEVLKSPTNDKFKKYSQALHNRLLHHKIIQFIKEKVIIIPKETSTGNFYELLGKSSPQSHQA